MVRKRREDFTQFLRSILQNSMLTGVPQIASAGNAPKKIVRALVFVLCIAGFIYQSMVFMDLYWKYETTIDVQVTNPKLAELPAITICNMNGLKNSEVCKENTKYRVNCTSFGAVNDSRLCKCNPNLCKNGYPDDSIWVPSLDVIKEINNLDHAQRMSYMLIPKHLVYSCRLELAFRDKFDERLNVDDIAKNVQCSTGKFQETQVCYTLFSQIDRPDIEQLKVLPDAVIRLGVSPQPIEYPTLISKVSTQISFHNGRQVINPFVDGFTMEMGKRYDFNLKKTVKKRLPPPYETNCFDYITAWKSRGGRGPLNERECIGECQANASLAVRGCKESSFKYPGNYKTCMVFGSENSSLEIMKRVQLCAEQCRPACYEESYEVVQVVSELQDKYTCIDVDDISEASAQNVLAAAVHLSGMETTTYVYSPKFQNIETFSYLGGYVGMWLGISLVAVFDFLETLVLMLRYPFRRCMQDKEKQRKIEDLRRLQKKIPPDM